MPLVIDEPEQVSYEEARQRGVNGLLDDGSRHPIAIDTDHGGVVLVPREVADQVMDALDKRDDIYDLVQAVCRMATDNGERHSLDSVIAELGFSQADLDAAD
jgi:hypothetical protein